MAGVVLTLQWRNRDLEAWVVVGVGNVVRFPLRGGGLEDAEPREVQPNRCVMTGSAKPLKPRTRDLGFCPFHKKPKNAAGGWLLLPDRLVLRAEQPGKEHSCDDHRRPCQT